MPLSIPWMRQQIRRFSPIPKEAIRLPPRYRGPLSLTPPLKEVVERMEASSSDKTLFRTALVTLYVTCTLTVASLRFLDAPPAECSRHARVRGPGLGPHGEPPPPLWLTLFLPHGRHRSDPLILTILALNLLHYIHRTLIYPLSLLIEAGFPLFIALVAFCFNLLSAYIQIRSAPHHAEYPVIYLF